MMAETESANMLYISYYYVDISISSPTKSPTDRIDDSAGGPPARVSLDLRLALADGQALLAVKPLRLLSIQNVALGAKKNVQPAITKLALLGRQLPQAAAQGVVSRSTRSIAYGLAIGLYQAARPALAHLVGG